MEEVGYFAFAVHNVEEEITTKKHRYEFCWGARWIFPKLVRDDPDHWGGSWALMWTLYIGPLHIHKWLRRELADWEKKWRIEYALKSYLGIKINEN